MRARAQTGPARLLDSCQGRQQRSRTSSHSRGLLRTHPARAARRRNVRATTPRESPHHRLAALDAGAEVPFLGSRRIIVAAVAAGRRGPNASRVAALRPKHPYKSTTEGGRLRMHRKRCDRYDHPTSWSSARAPQVDHALPDKRAPDAAHQTTAAQNSIDGTTTTHSQYLSKREQKTPQKTLLTALSNRTTS